MPFHYGFLSLAIASLLISVIGFVLVNIGMYAANVRKIGDDTDVPINPTTVLGQSLSMIGSSLFILFGILSIVKIR